MSKGLSYNILDRGRVSFFFLTIVAKDVNWWPFALFLHPKLENNRNEAPLKEHGTLLNSFWTLISTVQVRTAISWKFWNFKEGL
jgi:hypothetical protein